MASSAERDIGGAATVSIPARILHDHIRAGAPKRERLVALFAVFAVPLMMVFLFLLPHAPSVALRFTTPLIGMVYIVALLGALYRGYYHPIIPWITVLLLETTLPNAFLLCMIIAKGPALGISAPLGYVAMLTVGISALHMNRLLSIVAGAVAAGELLLIYLLFVRPGMLVPPLETLSPVFIAVRLVMLFFAGVLAAFVAHYLIRQTEQALALVRERDLLGKYVLQERIGVGGMAEVYRATYCPEGGFEKPVAIKRILPAYASDPEFVAMFRREAEVGSRLTHRSIVQVFDVGRFGDSYFIAMEYVEGMSLRGLLKRRAAPLPLAAITYIGAEIADALEYVHGRRGPDGGPLGLLHRDVNPPNILLSASGEVKLADFGIVYAATHTSHTAGNMARGKLSYMAPEQLEGKQPLDGRADLFALGLTMLESIVGRHPFAGVSEGVLVRTLLDTDLPPAAELSAVPPDLQVVLRHTLRRDRTARIPTARALRDALGSLTAETAPYPDGQRLLAEAVQAAQGAPIIDPTKTVTVRVTSEADTQVEIPSTPPKEARVGAGSTGAR